MAWVNQRPIKTGTALDELPDGETIFISINRRASDPGFNLFDTAQVMKAAHDAWIYTEERMHGRTTALAIGAGFLYEHGRDFLCFLALVLAGSSRSNPPKPRCLAAAGLNRFRGTEPLPCRAG